jgi:hypothetical protein
VKKRRSRAQTGDRVPHFDIVKIRNVEDACGYTNRLKKGRKGEKGQRQDRPVMEKGQEL